MLSRLFKELSDATAGVRYGLDGFLYDAERWAQAFAALRKCAEGRPVLVVGNGPSLNQTPLDEFAAVPSIGMNKSDLLYPRVAWRPTLVMCTNTVVARQHGDQMIEANEKTFISFKNRHFLNRQGREKALFFLEKPGTPFSTDPTKYVALGPTVTYAALQMAFWMGADPVILFGVDHSFKFVGDPLTYEKMQGDDPNHFDPNYFKDSVWGTPDHVAMERCYADARHAFETHGRRVLDATIGGKLQIFEKISLENARSLCEVA
jgi:hypothetical protein